MNHIVILLTVMLSGCSLLEYLWLVPRARDEVAFNQRLIDKEILDAFVEVAQNELRNGELKGYDYQYETYRDVNNGVVEIGPYRESNVAGYSARAEIDRKHHMLKFTVKGALAYYTPLPVDKATQIIAGKLAARLQNMGTQ